ncbi:CehA/McbA family metallohydrolase [Nonomuraea sp. NPDC050547]|uniref:CehA/McbA family metallohydrolase n=1 Tax=Nonomuraea sp. NPDC050547 TaxID=3364368 RepID=UPI00378DCB2B
MCDDPMLPEPVAGALREYGGLLGEHGITWGEPEIHYVKLFARRRVLPPELQGRFWRVAFGRLAARYPGEPLEGLGARLAEPDYDEILRDTLEGELPAHAAALRLTPGGPVLDGTPRVILRGKEKSHREEDARWGENGRDEEDGREAERGRGKEDRGGENDRGGEGGRGEGDDRGGDADVRVPLLVDSRRPDQGADPVTVRIGSLCREISPQGAWLTEITPTTEVTLDGTPVDTTPLFRVAEAARVRLRSPYPCRWSVTGDGGQGWFPTGVPQRHDFHGRPYFHGDDLTLDVPAEPLTITATRGMEYDQARTELIPRPGHDHQVRLTPHRIYHAAARGWYGGDLHTHLNWAGDLVAAPADAAAAQHGEDLHVLNLLAGNVSGARVYDREALAHWIGRALPWSDATHIARMGAEYRNDLLGHAYAFGLTAEPGRLHTGFDGAPDWPPNAAALAGLRRLGALLGYSHPFGQPVRDDDPAKALFGPVARDCSASALVADAALGLVDSLDVLTHASIPATAAVYRRLLGAGNRLAVTAGTDTMISFTRSDNQSNPPGWGRVYARVDGALTAESFAAAVRARRTFATTGPWLELSVDGHGPGATVAAEPGGRLSVTATAIGPEVSAVRIRTADGVRAGAGRLGGGDDALTVTVELDVREPTYVLAEALCEPHPRTLTATGYALTSPVHVDVGGRQVARGSDVRWCLDWLDLLEDLVRTHARLDAPGQLEDHLELIERAREVYRTRLG